MELYFSVWDQIIFHSYYT